MRKLRFAILSFAHVHSWSYARVLRELENVEFVAIFDDDEARLKRASEQYGVEKTYTDFRKLLEKEELDAVIITSENAKHKDMAVAAAEHGVHILCEKPIATTLRDADDMLAYANRYNVKFQTAFVMRYHGVTVKVKELLENGEIGDIRVITTTNHGKYPGGWFGEPELAGGGAIMDHTVHTADLMRWYTKSEADTVYAMKAKNIRPQLRAEDAASMLIRFKNGVLGSIDCSWSRPDTWPIWGDVYMGIFGTEGYIVVDAFRSCIDLVTDKQPLKWIYFGTDCDLEMIKDFIRVIVEDRVPRASGWDGRQALEIALAAYKSIERDEPVKLPLKY
ncbi:MAG: gfo/Idh/MocA family oxidoreductase [Thermoprotei archaeon]|nr:MAG: gfo/Idh/MocA family oxidoreductase [Thermoprotei archaeon]